MKLRKMKLQVLYLGRNNPVHQHSLGGNWKKNSSAEKGQEILVDRKLNMSQQCTLATNNNRLPGSTRQSLASMQREMMLPLQIHAISTVTSLVLPSKTERWTNWSSSSIGP